MIIKGSWCSSMPFIRALIPLCLGIISYGSLNSHILLWVSVIACLFVIGFSTMPPGTRFRLRYLPGFIMLLLTFITGNFLSYAHDIRNDPIWFGSQQIREFTGTINSQPVKGAYYSSFSFRVDAVVTSGAIKAATGHILVKTKLGEDQFHKGDRLLIHKQPKLLAESSRAHVGYIKYLRRKNIRHQVNLAFGDFVFLHRPSHRDRIAALRHAILNRINKHIEGKNENALAKALLVGERAELDKDLSLAYANTGVIHIIAISGMHLALIYSIIAVILRPMERIQRLKWLKTILIIIALWVFSFICGASPSVLRSAVMFTFLLIGQRLEKDNYPLNTLGASAFLLLSLDPMLLYDIGFQLSYSAVGSLLLFNRQVSSLFIPENKLLAVGWNTVSTSVTAQILTTPLVMFHFHQFPLLFILSNLVAVPLSGIILIILILICVIDPITPAASFLGSAAGGLIRFMNNRIISLGSVPFGKWENININWYEVVNIYLIILLLSLWLRSKK